MNRWLWLLLALLPQILWAEPKIMVRAANSNQNEFLAWLNGRADVVSYSDWWVRHRVARSDEERLRALLTSAQQEFLTGELAKARALFSNLADLATTQDWRKSERQALAYAELRLAQLETDSDAAEEHLSRAAHWGAVGLQAELFPSPLWQRYEGHIKRRRLEPLSLPATYPDARYLLVDGLPLNLETLTSLEVDEAEHRFTLVFDHKPPVTQTGTWETLGHWQISDQGIAQGECANPEVGDQSLFKRSQPPLKSLQIFYSSECQIPWPTEAPKNLPSPIFNPARETPPLPPLDTSSVSGRPVWQNGWFWGLAGAAVLTFAMMNAHRNTEPTPTTTVGF